MEKMTQASQQPLESVTLHWEKEDVSCRVSQLPKTKFFNTIFSNYLIQEKKVVDMTRLGISKEWYDIFFAIYTLGGKELKKGEKLWEVIQTSEAQRLYQAIKQQIGGEIDTTLLNDIDQKAHFLFEESVHPEISDVIGKLLFYSWNDYEQLKAIVNGYAHRNEQNVPQQQLPSKTLLEKYSTVGATEEDGPIPLMVKEAAAILKEVINANGENEEVHSLTYKHRWAEQKEQPALWLKLQELHDQLAPQELAKILSQRSARAWANLEVKCKVADFFDIWCRHTDFLEERGGETRVYFSCKFTSTQSGKEEHFSTFKYMPNSWKYASVVKDKKYLSYLKIHDFRNTSNIMDGKNFEYLVHQLEQLELAASLIREEGQQMDWGFNYIITFKAQEISWHQINKLLSLMGRNKKEVLLFLDAKIVPFMEGEDDSPAVPEVPKNVFLCNDPMSKVVEFLDEYNFSREDSENPFPTKKSYSYLWAAKHFKKTYMHPDLQMKGFGDKRVKQLGEVEVISSTGNEAVVGAGGLFGITSDTTFLVFAPTQYQSEQGRPWLCATAKVIKLDWFYSTIEIDRGELAADEVFRNHFIIACVGNKFLTMSDSNAPKVNLMRAWEKMFEQQVRTRAVGRDLQEILLIPGSGEKQEKVFKSYNECITAPGCRRFAYEPNMKIPGAKEDDRIFAVVRKSVHQLCVAACLQDLTISQLDLREVKKKNYTILDLGYLSVPKRETTLIVVRADESVKRKQVCGCSVDTFARFNFRFIALNDGEPLTGRQSARGDKGVVKETNKHHCALSAFTLLCDEGVVEGSAEWTGKNTLFFDKPQATHEELVLESIEKQYPGVRGKIRTLIHSLSQKQWSAVLQLYRQIQEQVQGSQGREIASSVTSKYEEILSKIEKLCCQIARDNLRLLFQSEFKNISIKIQDLQKKRDAEPSEWGEIIASLQKMREDYSEFFRYAKELWGDLEKLKAVEKQALKTQEAALDSDPQKLKNNFEKSGLQETLFKAYAEEDWNQVISCFKEIKKTHEKFLEKHPWAYEELKIKRDNARLFLDPKGDEDSDDLEGNSLKIIETTLAPYKPFKESSLEMPSQARQEAVSQATDIFENVVVEDKKSSSQIYQEALEMAPKELKKTIQAMSAAHENKEWEKTIKFYGSIKEQDKSQKLKNLLQVPANIALQATLEESEQRAFEELKGLLKDMHHALQKLNGSEKATQVFKEQYFKAKILYCLIKQNEKSEEVFKWEILEEMIGFFNKNAPEILLENLMESLKQESKDKNFYSVLRLCTQIKESFVDEESKQIVNWKALKRTYNNTSLKMMVGEETVAPLGGISIKEVAAKEKVIPQILLNASTNKKELLLEKKEDSTFSSASKNSLIHLDENLISPRESLILEMQQAYEKKEWQKVIDFYVFLKQKSFLKQLPKERVLQVSGMFQIANQQFEESSESDE